jgi:hypothetical protein
MANTAVSVVVSEDISLLGSDKSMCTQQHLNGKYIHLNDNTC